MELDAGSLHVVLEIGGDARVRDDRVDLVERCDVDETPAAELAGVEDGDHLLGGIDHRLVEAGLLEVRCGDAVLDADRVHAEEELVAIEILERRLGEHAHGGVGDRAHLAAQGNDAEAVVVVERDGDVEGVRDDCQVVEAFEVLGDLHRGGAGIEDDGLAVGDHLRGELGEQLLLAGVQVLLLADRHVVVVAGLVHVHGAALDAEQQLLLLEDGEVLADGYFRDVELLHQIGDVDLAVSLQLVEQETPAFLGGEFPFHDFFLVIVAVLFRK